MSCVVTILHLLVCLGQCTEPAYGFIARGNTPFEFIEGTLAGGVQFNDYGEIGFARRAVQFGVKIIF